MVLLKGRIIRKQGKYTHYLSIPKSLIDNEILFMGRKYNVEITEVGVEKDSIKEIKEINKSTGELSEQDTKYFLENEQLKKELAELKNKE